MSASDNDGTNEIFSVASQKHLAEIGGGHGQKGVDFQRYWALMRIFELEAEGTEDFLFLFEAIQDVAEFNSVTSPTSVRVYQVKKMDRGEWSWARLTKLPSTKVKKTVPAKRLAEIKESPIGKLYASVIAFKQIDSTGHFISNAGCDLPLNGGGNAATSLPCSLSSLESAHHALLTDGLKALHSSGMSLPDLTRIHVERVSLPPDDPHTHLVGLVSKFLNGRSPRHAGQARSLVDSLMAKIGPLGAKTAACKTFEEMKRMHGFSHKELKQALGDLELLPDSLSYLDQWLSQLGTEGMDFMEITSIKAAAASFYRRQVMGNHSQEEATLLKDCDQWLEVNPQNGSITEYFSNAYSDLSAGHSSFKKPEFFALFALRAIKKCVDPT